MSGIYPRLLNSIHHPIDFEMRFVVVIPTRAPRSVIGIITADPKHPQSGHPTVTIDGTNLMFADGHAESAHRKEGNDCHAALIDLRTGRERDFYSPLAYGKH